MHVVKSAAGLSKADAYREMNSQRAAVLAGESSGLANAANMAAILWQSLHDLNWAGFYFLRGRELVLGPFQGKPACVRIPLGKGVCGTAVTERRSVLVDDVRAFPGHIACDTASRSELVVPLLSNTGPTEAVPTRAGVLGVLDLDSPLPGRFDPADQAGCEAIAAMLIRHLTPS